MASNYARGRGLEYRAKAMLEALGYHVTRAASSKGTADLVASRAIPGVDSAVDLFHVSCKLGKGGARPAERVELAKAANAAGATPYLAWQRKPRAQIEWYLVATCGEIERDEQIEAALNG